MLFRSRDVPYTREQAEFQLYLIVKNKFWPTVRRGDDAYGDRNLICACAPIEANMESEKNLHKRPEQSGRFFISKFR